MCTMQPCNLLFLLLFPPIFRRRRQPPADPHTVDNGLHDRLTSSVEGHLNHEELAVAFEETDDSNTYVVLINDEEQYSLWPEFKKIPDGWRAVGMKGTRQECSGYVDKVWTDMRPLSLRQSMQATQERQAAAGTPGDS